MQLDRLSLELYFNPHSHKGSDWYQGQHDGFGSAISIHTPIKGVTGIKGSMTDSAVQFQSTLP